MRSDVRPQPSHVRIYGYKSAGGSLHKLYSLACRPNAVPQNPTALTYEANMKFFAALFSTAALVVGASAQTHYTGTSTSSLFASGIEEGC
jgi:hypothetical protein